MADHPNAATRRALFHAFWDEGDMQPMLDSVAETYEWRNDIGAGPFRHLKDKDESLAFGLWWMTFFEGTFRYELLDVCASDERVIEVLRERGEKDGHVFDNRALYVYAIGADGRYTSCTTFDQDRAAVEEFWSHFPEVMATPVDEALAPFLPAPAI